MRIRFDVILLVVMAVGVLILTRYAIPAILFAPGS